MINKNKSPKPKKKYSSREWSSTRLRSAGSDLQTSQGVNGLTFWIDILAKVAFVITAMLYVVGRKYAESYYATMGLPSNNLPISVPEYIFMSTRSFSFLNKAFYTSLASIILGILPTIISLAKELIGELLGKIGLRSKHQASDSNPSQSDKTAPNENNPLIPVWSLIRVNLFYIIPIFMALGYIFLLPGAKESGRIDATSAMLSAPFSQVLLNQPSMPELVPTTFPGQLSSTIYQYNEVQIIGNLGNQWLFLVPDSSKKLSVISIPDSQIVSIRYFDIPIPTPTQSLNAPPSPTVTGNPISTAIPKSTP